MKTKERILIVSLDLFNELGEPNVTTVDISNEMDISPGNLYYHYRNKDEIVEHIVHRYEHELLTLLNAENDLNNFVEYWLFLKFYLEKNWQYRFIFRDMNNLFSKYRPIHRKMNRLIQSSEKTILKMIQKIVSSSEHQEPKNSEAFVTALSTNVMNTLMNLPYFLSNRHEHLSGEELVTHTGYQAFIQLIHYFNPDEQKMLEELAVHY